MRELYLGLYPFRASISVNKSRFRSQIYGWHARESYNHSTIYNQIFFASLREDAPTVSLIKLLSAYVMRLPAAIGEEESSE